MHWDDLLIFSHVIQESHMSRDSYISPAESAFYNKYKDLCQKIEFQE